jgi:hypothetical protein
MMSGSALPWSLRSTRGFAAMMSSTRGFAAMMSSTRGFAAMMSGRALPFRLLLLVHAAPPPYRRHSLKCFSVVFGRAEPFRSS